MCKVIIIYIKNVNFKSGYKEKKLKNFMKLPCNLKE